MTNNGMPHRAEDELAERRASGGRRARKTALMRPARPDEPPTQRAEHQRTKAVIARLDEMAAACGTNEALPAHQLRAMVGELMVLRDVIAASLPAPRATLSVGDGHPGRETKHPDEHDIATAGHLLDQLAGDLDGLGRAIEAVNAQSQRAPARFRVDP